MQTTTPPPATQPPTARPTLVYALLAAAIGAVVSTLTVFVAFFVLNPTVITQAKSFDDFTFALIFLGGPHMLFCGPPGCLAGALAGVPGWLIARRAQSSRGALLAVLVVAFGVGMIVGGLVQWGMLQLYALLFPGGISFQPNP